jgi:hypothetical protein|eukprot:COSAG01_NODE_2925_length_6841_cov_3.547612_4_plen_80_part_00
MAPKLEEVTTKAAATDGRVATIESRQKVELEELKVGFVKSLTSMNDTISELEGKIDDSLKSVDQFDLDVMLAELAVKAS